MGRLWNLQEWSLARRTGSQERGVAGGGGGSLEVCVLTLLSAHCLLPGLLDVSHVPLLTQSRALSCDTASPIMLDHTLTFSPLD